MQCKRRRFSDVVQRVIDWNQGVQSRFLPVVEVDKKKQRLSYNLWKCMKSTQVVDSLLYFYMTTVWLTNYNLLTELLEWETKLRQSYVFTGGIDQMPIVIYYLLYMCSVAFPAHLKILVVLLKFGNFTGISFWWLVFLSILRGRSSISDMRGADHSEKSCKEIREI